MRCSNRSMLLAVALVLAACGSTGGSTESLDLQAGAPTVPAPGALDPASIMGVETAVAGLARQASGVRELLGGGADDTFRLLGEARAAAQADAAAQLAVLPLVRAGTAVQSAAASWVEVPMAVMMVTMMTGQIARAAGRSGGQPAALPSITSTSTINGVTTSLEYHPTVAGSKVEATVLSTVTTMAPNGTTITETISVTLASDICPDPQGNVPLHLTVRTRSSAGTRGYDYFVDMSGIARIGEDGQVSGYHMDGRLEFTLAPGNTLVPGGGGMFVEWAGSIDTGKDTAFRVTRTSQNFDGPFARNTGKELLGLAHLYVSSVLLGEGDLWRNGSCVEILAEGLKAPYKESNQDTLNRIVPDGERPFLVMVRHRFEAVDLAVQVGAALESGGASVTPASGLVPAMFAYRAGPAEAQDAVVALSTMSRRGGAKLRVGFQTSCNPAPGMVRPGGSALAATCQNAWAGTSTVTLDQFPSLKSKVTATVTWMYSAALSTPGTAVYQPSGAFTVVEHIAGEGCTVVPDSTAIGPTDGQLVVYYGMVDPQVNFGNGQSDVMSTVTCPGRVPFSAPASFLWFQGPGAMNSDGLRITGAGSDPEIGTSWSYDFSRQ